MFRSEVGLGCHKSPKDRRDYLMRNYVAELRLPIEFDLTEQMTQAENQGNEGSCVGFASKSVKEYQELKDTKKALMLSARFIYEEAKKISGHSEGTTLMASSKVVKKLGVPLNIFWQYVPNEVGEPREGYLANAKKFRVKSYTKITNLRELKQAIVNPDVGASMIGINVFKGMMTEECRKTGVVPDPSCLERTRVLGGHAICVVGYKDDSPYYEDGHIKFKNSWGMDWGDKGYGYLSYKYIKANMMDAIAWVDILGSLEKKRLSKNK